MWCKKECCLLFIFLSIFQCDKFLLTYVQVHWFISHAHSPDKPHFFTHSSLLLLCFAFLAFPLILLGIPDLCLHHTCVLACCPLISLEYVGYWLCLFYFNWGGVVTRNWTQDLTLAKQALQHWIPAKYLFPIMLILNSSSDNFNVCHMSGSALNATFISSDCECYSFLACHAILCRKHP